MQTVILAGGYGTRIMEETQYRPKPMIEIGGMPIIWHIMKIYAHQGHKEFILCLGYKGSFIKDYFINFMYNNSDITINTTNNSISFINKKKEDKWIIHLVDTGLETKTANRIKKISHLINGDSFFMTYGDGLANIDLKKLLKVHNKEKKIATVTAVTPTPRFGKIKIKNNLVRNFKEKINDKESFINGGFFVLNKKIFKYIDEKKNSMWEQEPMKKLTKNNELSGYIHEGFWQPVDTLRDKNYLEELWKNEKAPWKIWK